MSLPDFLTKRLRIPAIGSPLFIVSNPDLVIAQCTAGIVGSFPALRNPLRFIGYDDPYTGIPPGLGSHTEAIEDEIGVKGRTDE